MSYSKERAYLTSLTNFYKEENSLSALTNTKWGKTYYEIRLECRVNSGVELLALEIPE